MRDAYPRFRELGAEVAVVTFASQEETDRFCEGAPFPCLADPSREAYDAFGLERRPSAWRIFDPRQAGAFVRATLAGHRARRTRLSSLQLGGTFVLDRDGEIRYAHRNRNPADNPPLEELLRAVEGLRSRA